MAHAQYSVGDREISGSLCVGIDCVNGESFGFDTLRLKENNLRLHFQDTSTSASFPTNDWRLVANDSSNGGLNYLAVEDSTAGRIPFRVEAGARADALYVEADGDIGIGTNNPAVDLHVKTGNTPTLRLEQDGSSGFTAQTWDLAGNEANFFIRDVTGGSKLTFKIKPGAPTSSIFVAADGDIGLQTETPDANLHVKGSFLAEDTDSNTAPAGGYAFRRDGTALLDLQSTTSGPVQYRLISAGAANSKRIVASQAGGTPDSQIIFNAEEIRIAGSNDGVNLLATLDLGGINLPAGRTFSVGGTNLNVPDYVFAPDYELMPLSDLQAFIAENSHLPNVPSAAEIEGGSLNMVKMQLTLLEKVEELTLYTLQQQKTIDALQAQLAAQ